MFPLIRILTALLVGHLCVPLALSTDPANRNTHFIPHTQPKNTSTTDEACIRSLRQRTLADNLTERTLIRVAENTGSVIHENLVTRHYELGDGFVTRTISREVEDGLPPYLLTRAHRAGVPADKLNRAAYGYALSRIRSRSIGKQKRAIERSIILGQDGFREKKSQLKKLSGSSLERQMDSWEKKVSDPLKYFFPWPNSFIDNREFIANDVLNDTFTIDIVDKASERSAATLAFTVAPYQLQTGKRVCKGPFVRRFYGSNANRFRDYGDRPALDEFVFPLRQLPMNHYLGIDFYDDNLNDGAYLDIEARNFVIDKRFGTHTNRRHWVELWLHLVKFVFANADEELNLFRQNVYTYADPMAVKLYGRLGFKFLRKYYLHGNLVDYTDEEKWPTPPPIWKGDSGLSTIENPTPGMVPWWPMIWSPLQIIAYNNRLEGQTAFDHVDIPSRRLALAEPLHSESLLSREFATLFEYFKKGDVVQSRSAQDSILKRCRQISTYWERLERASEGKRVEIAMHHSLFDLEASRIELRTQLDLTLKSTNPSDRLKLTNLVGRLIQNGHPSAPLNSAEGLTNYLIPLMADSAEHVRRSAFANLKHSLFPVTISKTLEKALETEYRGNVGLTELDGCEENEIFCGPTILMSPKDKEVYFEYNVFRTLVRTYSSLITQKALSSLQKFFSSETSMTSEELNRRAHTGSVHSFFMVKDLDQLFSELDGLGVDIYPHLAEFIFLAAQPAESFFYPITKPPTTNQLSVGP